LQPPPQAGSSDVLEEEHPTAFCQSVPNAGEEGVEIVLVAEVTDENDGAVVRLGKRLDASVPRPGRGRSEEQPVMIIDDRGHRSGVWQPQESTQNNSVDLVPSMLRIRMEGPE
jgi:hypothetical protein